MDELAVSSCSNAKDPILRNIHEIALDRIDNWDYINSLVATLNGDCEMCTRAKDLWEAHLDFISTVLTSGYFEESKMCYGLKPDPERLFCGLCIRLALKKYSQKDAPMQSFYAEDEGDDLRPVEYDEGNQWFANSRSEQFLHTSVGFVAPSAQTSTGFAPQSTGLESSHVLHTGQSSGVSKET